MKTLVRSLFVAVLIALGGSAAPAAAQRVWVDVRIGTPGYQYREYHRGHRWYRVYRQYNRSYGWQYRRPMIVVERRWHPRRPIIVYRSQRHGRHYDRDNHEWRDRDWDDHDRDDRDRH